MRLEVLVHLAQLPGAGEEAIKDRRRDPYHPKVVSERIERRHEIVPRVRAAANGEVASVRWLGSGAKRGSPGSAEVGDVSGVEDARCEINRTRQAATTVRQGLRCANLQKILKVERRLDKRVALEAGRPDHGIHVRLHGEVLHLQAPAADLLHVWQRGPVQMLHQSGAGGLHGTGADLRLAPALSGIPEVGHQEGAAGSVVEGLQARWLEQVGLHDLSAARRQRLRCSAGRVAARHSDLEFARCEQRVNHAAALSTGTSNHADNGICHDRLLCSLQAEGAFSARASTSRRGLGGPPPRRSTSPVTTSNAPAAKLAWMPTTVLTTTARRPARVSPARSCASVITRNASA